MKGLIFQHNPMSRKTANGKTLAAFFRAFEAKDLAQIYVTPEATDINLCANYFFLSEKTMAAAFFGRTGKLDGASSEEGIAPKVSSIRRRLYKAVGSLFRNSLTRFRDMLWRRRYWDTAALWDWIDEFNPDFMFFSVGDVAAEYEFALEITRRRNIPLIVHIGDDYFTGKVRFPFGKRRYQQRTADGFRSLYNRADLVVAISDALRDAVTRRFGGNAERFIVAMNAIDPATAYTPYTFHEGMQRIIYIGNLGLHRTDTLLLLLEAVEKLKRKGFRAMIEVYTNTDLSASVRKRIKNSGNCRLMGAAAEQALKELREGADILLHVESFRPRWKRILETAMSTKTPEIMQAGRPILAVGPAYSATVAYIRKNDLGLAITSSSPKEIADALEAMLLDRALMCQRIERARAVAAERFDIHKNAAALYKAIENAVINFQDRY